MSMAGNFGASYVIQASPSYCIGSGCMAWRWYGDSPAFPNSGPEDTLNYNARKGYCGKASKP